MMNLFENLQMLNEAAYDEKLYKFILFRCPQNIEITKIDKYTIEKLNNIDLYIIYEIHIFNNLTAEQYTAFCNHIGIENVLKTINDNIQIITRGRGATKSSVEFSLDIGDEKNNSTVLPDEFDAWIRRNGIKVY